MVYDKLPYKNNCSLIYREIVNLQWFLSTPVW